MCLSSIKLHFESLKINLSLQITSEMKRPNIISNQRNYVLFELEDFQRHVFFSSGNGLFLIKKADFEFKINISYLIRILGCL